MKRKRRVFLLLLSVAVLALPAESGSGGGPADCAITPRASRAPTPALTNLSKSWWLRNRVWMGVAGAFKGEGFRAKRQKVGWYRARPGALRVYGKRLDRPPAEFTVEVPSGYGRSGFQPSSVTFGAPGCWAVTAVVGGQASRFIVGVATAD